MNKQARITRPRNRRLALAGTAAAGLLLSIALFASCASSANASVEAASVRVGYFPNVTHAQVLVGLSQGGFQQALGPDVKIKAKRFNAGPALIEALYAGEIDLGYVGPSPAINGYVHSGGKALRVIAGSASGGASLVIRSEAGIAGSSDLKGKRIASPQLGNSQDVSLRWHLKQEGFKTKDRGGSVTVLPARNPDIFTLFRDGRIDGAWVPEPWASRLVAQAGGDILIDERDLWLEGKFATTIVIARSGFLKKNSGLVKRWLAAHVDVTAWINGHPQEAQAIVVQEIERLTSIRLAPSIVAASFDRLSFQYDPVASSIAQAADRSYHLGFFTSKPNVAGIVDLNLLNALLREKQLPEVR
jgi:NitT/TauT family transport system substrate-binding protein